MNSGYVPKCILVTGGCGFIGSHVVNYLVQKYPNTRIINVDKMDYCSNSKNITVAHHENYKFYKLNLAKHTAFLAHILDEHQVDTVMHFAAQTHVDNSFMNSHVFIKDNICATVQLLEACNQYGGIKRFIHVSTDEVYGDDSLEACSEDTKLNPTNPYSVTKTCAELFVRSFYKCYKLPVIITRGNNVYGIRQYTEKVIPKFTKQLLEGKKCTVHGSGANYRNYIHTDDVCTAFDTILRHGVVSQIYNIGTKNVHDVLSLAKKIAAIVKPNDDPEKWIEFVQDRPWNDRHYHICNSALRALGWEEKKDFDEGLREVIQWYMDNQGYWDTD